MKGVFTALYDSMMRYTWLGHFQDKNDVNKLYAEFEVLKKQLVSVEVQLAQAKQVIKLHESSYARLRDEYDSALVEIHANRSIIKRIKGILL